MPTCPVDFPLITMLPPLELPNQSFNIVAQRDGKLEAAHGISRDGLDNGFQKDFPARLREELLFPALELCPDPLLNKIQAGFIRLAN